MDYASAIIIYLTEQIRLLIQSEARSLVGLSQDHMASAHTFHVASKRSFMLATVHESVSIPDSLIAKHGWLSSTERKVATSLQICWILPFFSKVCVGFKSLPIILIISYCFFVVMKNVKHGHLFSENLTLSYTVPVLANFTHSMALICDDKKWSPLLNHGSWHLH